jgi:hypothetical protein
MMDEKRFDELWEQEERQGLQQRLRQDYPVWLHRRRQRRTTLVSAAVLLVGISFFTFNLSVSSQPYDAVCCNRSGIAEGHWVDVAANILKTEMI